MHKIERLLQTLAPKGVEFRKLGEVCEIIRGKRVTKKEILDKGKYPVVSGGIGFMGYLNEYNREENTITIAQYGTAGFVNWQNQKFWANDVCFSVIPKETLINRYLYYVLTNMQNYLYSISNRSAIPYSISSNNIMQITIPIPPLEIQQEIVKILDAFTELNTELNTELKARKKQYEYYQNMLLDFKDIHLNHKDAKMSAKTYPKRLQTLLQTLAPKGVEFRKLGDIGKPCMCKRVMKHQTTRYGEIPFYKIGTFGNTADAFISKKLFLEYKTKYSFPKKGDILISASGTIGKAVIYDGKPAYFQDSNIVWIDNDETLVKNDFLFYVYSNVKWNTEHTTILRLYNDNFRNTLIPIPPLEIQQEIVKILDQFSILTTDLLAGIPAEIKARKKQYEYYREKLLTFKPLKA